MRFSTNSLLIIAGFFVIATSLVFGHSALAQNTQNIQTTQNPTQTNQVLSTQAIGAQPATGLVLGASVEDLKRKIEEQTRNIEALNKEIQTYSALKDKTTKEAQTLQALIKELDRNAKVLDLDIKKTKSQISKADLEINKIDDDIETSQEKISRYRELIADSLRQIEFTESTGFIPTLLAKRDLSDALTEINDRVNLNDQVKNEVDTLRQEKITLEITKVDKEKKIDELNNFQETLADKKKVVEYNKNERNKVLTETKNQEANYQKLLKEKLAAKAAFEKELFAYESTLKYTLDPSSLPQSGTTALSWPLEKIRVTQLFGKTVAAKRLYTSGSHNGVDFGASIGTPVLAAGPGVVAGAGDTDLVCPRASFGKWILIKHPNGLATIYAHLSVISVSEGQNVTVGQTIGYSGNSGYSTGPHLHFGAYAANAVNVENRPSISCGGKVYRMPIAPIDAYLDPMIYLPKP